MRGYGIVLGKKNISATSIWEALSIGEQDKFNETFLAPGKLELELADQRMQSLRTRYFVEGFDPKDVAGYKIPLRSL